MSAFRPPLPPHPGRAYSDTIGDGNAGYDSHPSSSSNGSLSLHYVLPRSNTTPTASYTSEALRPPVPQRPGDRPRTAPGGPQLPTSLMPGAKRGQTTDEHHRAYDSALFFEPFVPHNTRRSTFTAERSFRRSESPPPLPPPPPGKFKPALPPKPNALPHSVSESSARSSTYDMLFRPSASPLTAGKPPASAPAVMSNRRPVQQLLSQSPIVAESPMADEGDELVRALELSMADQAGSSESDDEILARVLQESLSTYVHTSPPISSLPDPQASSAHSIAPAVKPPFSLHHVSSSSTLFSSLSSTVTSSSVPGSPVNHNSEPPQHVEYAMLTSERTFDDELERKRLQMQMDEELARRLAEEDEAESSRPATPPSISRQGSKSRSCSRLLHKDDTEAQEGTNPSSAIQSSVQLPRYEDTIGFPHGSSSPVLSAPSNPVLSPLHQHPNVHSTVTDSMPTSSRPLPPSIPLTTYPSPALSRPSLNNLGRSTSAQAIVSNPAVDTGHQVSQANVQPPMLHSSRPNSVTPVHRAQSANAVLPNASTSITSRAGFPTRMSEPAPSIVESEESVEQEGSSLEDYHKSVEILGPRAPVSALEVQNAGTSEAAAPSPQIVEDELLMGVSFGFNAPSIGLSLTPMHGPLPNIIALPYGKCPPLHIQAPSWKHLLKLLARLSDSRIEPTVEAVAVNKTELKLRTVIQFVKVHHASSEWRTLLYLSIDVPVPPQIPNAFKYVNGDVSTLPFSYTMTPLPTLLRDASDSNLAKWYSVPATIATPYPTLPITLPNYALYLQAVLRDSRRAMNDSSSGLRRLARTVDTIYPPTAEHMEGLGPEASAPERHRVGNFFRRALGRGDRNSGQRGGNDESYEFITPFRIDDYS